MSLINKTKFLNDADFIIRMLYQINSHPPDAPIGCITVLTLCVGIIC